MGVKAEVELVRGKEWMEAMVEVMMVMGDGGMAA